MLTFSKQPDGDLRLGDFLKANLSSSTWTSFRAALAFVKLSGVRHIAAELSTFGERGGKMRISVGVDCRGTSAEGLRALLRAVGPDGEIWVFHNESDSTFHPKVYLFSKENGAEVYIGSGNLTEGGLFTNYEVGVRFRLDLTSPIDREFHDEVLQALDSWAGVGEGTGQRLTELFLARLIAFAYILPERETAEAEEESTVPGQASRDRSPREKLFAAIGVRRAPKEPRIAEPRRQPRVSRSGLPEKLARPVGFVMTLQQTDVGTGQITKGTSRRSPEIFIPLVARDAAPEFWGFPDRFVEDKAKPGKMDRFGVHMRIGGEVVEVNMMTWPDKHDFRLRSEALRSAGEVGDLLRLEVAPQGSAFDYYAEVIPANTSQFDRFAAICVEQVRQHNSRKRFGYY